MHRQELLLVGVITGTLFLITGCATQGQVRQILTENPEILFSVIEKNPMTFTEVTDKAYEAAKVLRYEKQLDEEFQHPRTPDIENTRAIRGNPSAMITIVEYSDFQCPYCRKASETLEEVRKKYGDRIRYIFKHLPLSNHPMAMPAAQWFEATALQGGDKAYAFHDEVFQHQDRLTKDKESFLKEAAQKVAGNVDEIMRNLASPQVKMRIDADMAEAKKFGFDGTPVFLINGVALQGAQALPEFEKIIDRWLNKLGSASVPSTGVSRE